MLSTLMAADIWCEVGRHKRNHHAPGIVRDQQARVHDQADAIIDRLRLRECLQPCSGLWRLAASHVSARCKRCRLREDRRNTRADVPGDRTHVQ